jgi:ribonuclease HI
MAEKNRFYTVWKGKKPGVYSSWEACKRQIEGVPGAQYMGFPDEKRAIDALKKGYAAALSLRKTKTNRAKEQPSHYGSPSLNSIAVDAASSGNPGPMEYQGVDTKTGRKLFHQGPFPEGTNNIGEFLAIVHGLAYLKNQGSDRIIYSDSKIAIGWVKKKHCNTKLEINKLNKPLFEMIQRAEQWLKNHRVSTPILKWETKLWGEIPADFGRK